MPAIRSEDRGGWRMIVLDRPARLNAFTAAMNGELMQALDDALADPACRALLLTGAGRAFCAGQDLEAAGSDLGDILERQFNPLVRRLRSAPVPVVCAVNGVAAGAGANVALACDIVLAARSAKFIEAFAKIGLVPDCGGTWFLPRLVGEARARALAMTAAPVTAEQAAAWGMIWRMVEDDALMTEAEALTAHLATQPTHGLALTKRALAAAASNTLDAQLNLERDLQREAGATLDYAEGVRAFIEKRAPAFTGHAVPAPAPVPHPMWAADAASQGLGMTLLGSGPGHAQVAMTVRPDMLNGHGSCHGGFIFALADSAFAFACNAAGEKALASSCTITYLRPGAEGDRLVATAAARGRAGRTGVIDVTVHDAAGTIVAEFRGQSRIVSGAS